jgi:predicted PhzF superfamily epimerase YddE/YHI9
MSTAGTESSGTPVTQVDVFTDELYTGNPAGVCMLHHWGVAGPRIASAAIADVRRMSATVIWAI